MAGACVGGTGCERGWFGPACQFVDLAVDGSELSGITINGVASIPELTDGNLDTCVPSYLVLTSLVKIWNSSHYITWLRLFTLANTDIRDAIHVQMRRETTLNSPIIECVNQRITMVTYGVYDVFCSNDGPIKQLIITGSGVSTLCALHISGGRNVALRQTADQTPGESERNASRAVDGNTAPYISQGGCSFTRTTGSSQWSVHLTQPTYVWRYVFIVSQDPENSSPLQTLKLTSSSIYGPTTIVSMDAIAGVYTYVPDLMQFVSTVKVEVPADDKNVSSLSLCEVELYGDSQCERGWFGRYCKFECNCALNEACYVPTGECPSGCAPGFYGEGCRSVCPSETYGLNCTGACSPYCVSNKNVEPSSCHHVSGVCLFGCRDGHTGAKCDSIICSQKGFYGPYCGQTCSQFCKTDDQSPDPICHHVSGICLLGCQDGYDGPRCDVKLCTNDTYGDLCQYNCSSYCKQNSGHMSCDPETGVCLLGCQDGYFGFFCDTATVCSSNTYGVDCQSKCSPTCLQNSSVGDSSCLQATGVCLYGCQDGYTGSYCQTKVVAAVSDTSGRDAGIGVGVAGCVIGIVCVVILVVVLRRQVLAGKKQKQKQQEYIGVIYPGSDGQIYETVRNDTSYSNADVNV